MSDYYNLKKKKAPNPKYDKYREVFQKITVEVSAKTAKMLTEISEERQVSVSRLVAYAIDNEFEVDVAFSFPCNLPENQPYIESEYYDEAGRLIHLIQKFPLGASIDTLMLCRRDIGIQDRKTLLLAYRELLTMALIEEFKPTSSKINYAKDYRRARVVEMK